MQATQAWCDLIERIAPSKREFWFTLIRVTIVVALVGTAARLVATAYAPQVSAIPQPLNCPPEVVTYLETVVPPQVIAVAEPSATSVTSDVGSANKPDLRSMIGKKQEHRSGPKKAPTYTLARNGVPLKRATMGELSKSGGTAANQQQKSRAFAPTLAHSGISPSPFGDMKGQ
jgi:hypothetical protein